MALTTTHNHSNPLAMQGLLDVGGGQERVVLKRVKARVQGADEMVQMEHLINVRGWRRGRGGGQPCDLGHASDQGAHQPNKRIAPAAAACASAKQHRWTQ